MSVLAKLTAVAVAAAVAVGTAAAGVRAEDVGRRSEPIVAGGRADVGEYPFVAFLSSPVGSCTGSLVHPWYVLTAAHCVVRASDGTGGPTPASGVRLTIGRTNLADPATGGEMRNATAVTVHPQYGGWYRPNDLALIRLDRASTQPVVEIAAPWGHSDIGSYVPGRTATLVGYGRTCAGCAPSNWLMETTGPVWRDSDARARDGSFDPPTMIAAGGFGSTICNGDSGGPALAQTASGWKVFGVLSTWVGGACDTNSPGGYAEVSGYRQYHWVRTILHETPVVGDFNGDGRDDIATFTHGPWKDVWVALSAGARFGASSVWHDNMGGTGERVVAGDFDGDRRDDIWVFSDSGLWIARSEGTRFSPGSSYHALNSQGMQPVVGDFSGDGRDDLYLVGPYNDALYENRGSSFAVLRLGIVAAGAFHEGTRVAADVDGDGDDDLVWFRQGAGGNDALVRLSARTRLEASTTWNDWFALAGEMPGVGRFDRDGRNDIVTFTKTAARDVYVATSNGSSFVGSRIWHGDFGRRTETLATGDFNGDGLDDIVAFTQDAAGDVFVSLNTGAGSFGAASLWHGWFAP